MVVVEPGDLQPRPIAVEDCRGPGLDLALLEVSETLIPARWLAADRKLAVGTPVEIAVRPMAAERHGGSYAGRDSSGLVAFTDVDVPPGSSGGALFDRRTRTVVGIVVSRAARGRGGYAYSTGAVRAFLRGSALARARAAHPGLAFDLSTR